MGDNKLLFGDISPKARDRRIIPIFLSSLLKAFIPYLIPSYPKHIILFLFKKLLVCMYVCALTHIWKSENNFYVNSWDQTQVARLFVASALNH